MKKLMYFAVALAAMAFTACGGKKKEKTTEETTDSLKSFEQEQVEASIKMHIDSLAANPSVAENATTLAEKYRMLSALSVDKRIAALYEMPTEDYDKAITKLAADINDPSFKEMEDASTIYETTQSLYNAMGENGRINYFWQLVATSLVEQLYIVSQNTEKFISAFDDDAASNITFRIVLLTDAVARLAEYDPEIAPVAKAIEPLVVLNAISVDQLKAQLAEAKEEITAARNNLVK